MARAAGLKIVPVLLALSVGACDSKKSTDAASTAPSASALPSASRTTEQTPSASPATGVNDKSQVIRETYGAWTLLCSPSGTGKMACLLSEAQPDPATGQKFSVTFAPAVQGELRASVVTPLGMSFQAGVLFQMDESPPIGPLQFETCMRDGCLVPAKIPAQSVAALKQAKVLKVGGNRIDGSPALASLPLEGLVDALERAAKLQSSGT